MYINVEGRRQGRKVRVKRRSEHRRKEMQEGSDEEGRGKKSIDNNVKGRKQGRKGGRKVRVKERREHRRKEMREGSGEEGRGKKSINSTVKLRRQSRK